MEGEIWKQIKDYEGLYEVSSLGRVKSIKKNGKDSLILKPGLASHNYFTVCLRHNSIGISKCVHRLVAETFLHNPDNKEQVNHKNGIKTDNRISNLEFVTRSENGIHAVKVLHKKPTWLLKTGSDHPKSKPILQFTKEGIFIAEYAGQYDASRKTGIGRSNISLVLLNKTKTAGGYIWKYKHK